MATNYPSVIPMIAYEDGIGALEWLAKAFGFRESMRLSGPDGTLSHGEMEAGDGVICSRLPRRPMRVRSGIASTASARADGRLFHGSLMVCSFTSMISRRTTGGRRQLALQSFPKSKLDRLVVDTEPKTLRVTAGSSSSEKGCDGRFI